MNLQTMIENIACASQERVVLQPHLRDAILRNVKAFLDTKEGYDPIGEVSYEITLELKKPYSQ